MLSQIYLYIYKYLFKEICEKKIRARPVDIDFCDEKSVSFFARWRIHALCGRRAKSILQQNIYVPRRQPSYLLRNNWLPSRHIYHPVMKIDVPDICNLFNYIRYKMFHFFPSIITKTIFLNLNFRIKVAFWFYFSKKQNILWHFFFDHLSVHFIIKILYRSEKKKHNKFCFIGSSKFLLH